MKKVLIFILIVLIIGAAFFIFKPKETPKVEKKVVPKTNEKLLKEQVVDNVLISNISLVTKNNKTVFSAKITNLTANELKYKNLQIIINDQTTLIGYFGENLKPEETKIVTAEASSNIKNIKSLELKLDQ